MKIVRINQLEGTEREVHGKGFVSFRALLNCDGMGFGLHKTVIPAGGPWHWHYLNHLEACYCIKGRGILHNLETDVKHLITPDTCYVLDSHDDHTFEALEDTVLLSIFNPAVNGKEVHDENGNY